jgi:hypothetical protein
MKKDAKNLTQSKQTNSQVRNQELSEQEKTPIKK